MYKLRLDTDNNTVVLTTDEGEKVYRPIEEPAVDLYNKLAALAKTDPTAVVSELEANAELVLPDPEVGFQEPEDEVDEEDPDQTDPDRPDHQSAPEDVTEDINPDAVGNFEDWKQQLGPDAVITQVDANGVTAYTARDSSGKVLGTFSADQNGNGVGMSVQEASVGQPADLARLRKGSRVVVPASQQDAYGEPGLVIAVDRAELKVHVQFKSYDRWVRARDVFLPAVNETEDDYWMQWGDALNYPTEDTPESQHPLHRLNVDAAVAEALSLIPKEYR